MASRNRSNATGNFVVNDKPCSTDKEAIAYAMHVVGREGVRDTLYVRDERTGQSVAAVERHEDGSVTLSRMAVNP